ncbi:hypothetical protein DAI22_10g096300 [Oryza sativa Japonica Group]|nr:hypothetical protein DAI22_10g096300 [Oryza sativa Japonica Group]
MYVGGCSSVLGPSFWGSRQRFAGCIGPMASGLNGRPDGFLRSSAWLTRCKVDASVASVGARAWQGSGVRSPPPSHFHLPILNCSPLPSLPCRRRLHQIPYGHHHSFGVFSDGGLAADLELPRPTPVEKLQPLLHPLPSPSPASSPLPAPPLFSVATIAFSDRQATRSGDHGGVEQLGAAGSAGEASQR